MTIRKWCNDIETNKYEKYKTLHTGFDKVGEMLETKNKILVTCSIFNAQYQIQFWDIELYELMGIVEDISTCGWRDMIQLTDDIICVNGSRDDEGLQLISISLRKKVKHLKKFNKNDIKSLYKTRDGRVYIGSGLAYSEDSNLSINYGNIGQFRFDKKANELIKICEKTKCHTYPPKGFYELSNGDFLSISKEIIIWK